MPHPLRPLTTLRCVAQTALVLLIGAATTDAYARQRICTCADDDPEVDDCYTIEPLRPEAELQAEMAAHQRGGGDTHIRLTAEQWCHDR